MQPWHVRRRAIPWLHEISDTVSGKDMGFGEAMNGSRKISKSWSEVVPITQFLDIPMHLRPARLGSFSASKSSNSDQIPIEYIYIVIIDFAD
jgi:hypothetical protein